MQATTTDRDAPTRPWWWLALVFVAAMTPVAAGTAARSVGPVIAAGLVISGFGALYGWIRYGSWRWQDSAIVTVLAAVAALYEPVFGLWTLLGGLCAASLLAARGIPMPWASWGSRPAWVGLAAAAGMGLALGAVNVVLAADAAAAGTAGGQLDGWLDGIRAGLWEELGIRACLLALCVIVLGRLPRTGREKVLTYMVLVVPHVAFHFVTMPSHMVGGTILLNVLFGLPLTTLLKRYGVVSAVMAHTLIDVIRLATIGAQGDHRHRHATAPLLVVTSA